MTGNKVQNVGDITSVRICPKRGDIIAITILLSSCLGILICSHWDIFRGRQYFGIFVYFICGAVLATQMCQRASIDSIKLRYHVLGLIPVKIYWYDVSQIGIVHVYSRSDHKVLGEMFAIVLKPCEKYEEGFRKLRWWHIRPKWRHPFLVKNIYCETGKYKEIIEECSRKKISFEREYS